MDKKPAPQGKTSDAPTNPGYPIDKSLQEATPEDLRRGYCKPSK